MSKAVSQRPLVRLDGEKSSCWSKQVDAPYTRARVSLPERAFAAKDSDMKKIDRFLKISRRSRDRSSFLINLALREIDKGRSKSKRPVPAGRITRNSSPPRRKKVNAPSSRIKRTGSRHKWKPLKTAPKDGSELIFWVLSQKGFQDHNPTVRPGLLVF